MSEPSDLVEGANDAAQAGEFLQAIDLFRQALALDPSRAESMTAKTPTQGGGEGLLVVHAGPQFADARLIDNVLHSNAVGLLAASKGQARRLQAREHRAHQRVVVQHLLVATQHTHNACPARGQRQP
jgi:hypothetical protein